MSKSKLQLSYFGHSDIGMVRSENQDSFGKFPEDDLDIYSGKGQLFVVADGVGGHTGGKEASSLAVKAVGDVFFSSYSETPSAIVKKAIEEANEQIYRKAAKSIELMRMATTCSVIILKDDKGTIGHVGDSRIYKIENNQIEQLTKDHTQVQEMLREGILTDEEADNYPSKSVLVRAVGVEEKVKIDIIENILLKKGQAFVLCSDGLGKVDADEILKLVSDNTPESSCQKLVNLANERGGKDNVTVQVIKVDSNEVFDVPKRSKKPALFAAILLILILLVGFLIKDSIPFLHSEEQVDDKNIIPEQTVTEKNNKVDEPQSNPQLEQANLLYKRGRMESALKIFKEILIREPMHLEALNGLNKIADFYFQKAEKLRKENNIKSALVYYQKVKDIQPDNEKSNYYISLYKKQMQSFPNSN